MSSIAEQITFEHDFDADSEETIDIQTSFLIKGTGSLAKHFYKSTQITPKKFDCKHWQTGQPCPSYQNNRDCIHSNKASKKYTEIMLESAIRTSEYFMERWEVELKSQFHSYEAYYEYCWDSHGQKGKPEVVYLANLFIALLYSQRSKRGTTDMIHQAVGNRYQADKRINGPVISRLLKGGFIQPVLRNGVPVRPRSIREVNHGSKKELYKLTEKGKDIIEAVT